MGCGCGMKVTQEPPRGQVDDGSFLTEGTGDDTQRHTRKASGVLVVTAGRPFAVWDAPQSDALTPEAMDEQPTEEVAIRCKEAPDAARITEHAKQYNKQRHREKVSLVQITRTRDAMCFMCPVLSNDRKTCLLAPNHRQDVDAIDVGPLVVERSAFVASNSIAWLREHDACPLGRFPQGDDQVVTWAGTRWYGVPEPLRWLIAVRRWKNDTLDKCGCCVVLKSLSKRWGFGWLSVLEKLPELRKDMARKKVFKGGPARFKGRAWRYLKWRAKRTLQG